MRFLILSVTAGQGHHKCAKALSDALIKKGHTAETLDVYKFVFSPLGETIDKGYLLSTKHIPELYGKFYQIADERGIGSAITKESQKLVYKKVAEYINEFEPDCLICTHVFPSIMLTSAKKHKKIGNIPTIGIITDFTVHPYWQKSNLDAYVVPSELLGYQCMKKNIPEEKVYPLGIPISEKFSENIPASDARKALGIEDKNTILFMTGSMGFGNVPELIGKIDSLDGDFQILCVCGNNRENFNEISSCEYRHNVYTYGFVDNINVMMDASDFIITKPGGLSVSESLAKHLPMILVEPIPGQETRNREFLLNSGLAVAVSRTLPLEEAVYRLNKNSGILSSMKTLTDHYAHPNSALDVSDLAIRLAEGKR
ncbi:MAG: galactosyldiacylglycerol synthase [Clostridia bacterium]|nr:galactosyldiacylglycerol synthase [Clostridia bacterium]